MRTEGTFDDAARPSRPADEDYVTPIDDVTESDDTEEIREGIEQTRADMSVTIDAIQEKLSPERLAEQAKEAVRDATVGRVENVVSSASESAKDAGNSFVDTIKQNPLPAAMAAVGIGWLWMNRGSGDVRNVKHIGPSYAPTSRRSTHGYYGGTDTGSREYPYPAGFTPGRGAQGYSGQYDEGQGRVGQAKEQVSEVAGQAKEQVGEFAGQAKEQAGEFAGQVQEQVGEWTGQAQYQARRAQYQFQDMFRNNPVAVAAIAFGVGAAVGMAIPETEKEDQILGEARDTVVDRAQAMAQETMNKVQSVMAEAKDAAADAAQQAAQDQGLAGDARS